MLLAGREAPPILSKYFGPGLDRAVEDWPADTLRAYQQEAVAEQLRDAYANNAFYRRKFDEAGVLPASFEKLEDLARFPTVTKAELLRQPWLLLAVPREEVRLVHTSTGTTGGDWSYQLYTWDDLFVRDVVPLPRRLLGVGRGDVVVNALPYEMSSAGQSFQRALQAGPGAVVVPAGKGGFYSGPDKTVSLMADLRAAVLITTPPYAMWLAEVAARDGLRPGDDIPLRCLWLTGEGCSPAYRRRLEELWRCPGLVFYGSLECGPIALECREQAGCHLCAGHVFVEVIDPRTGKSQPPGEVGEAVCTVLQRKASPLIRFRTQDLVILDPAPCRCGLALPRLHVRGRVVDEVAAASGPAFSPYQIEQVLYSQPEVGGNYQIYADQGRLLIDVETRGDPAGVLERTREQLARMGLRAELNRVEHIPRTGGKTRRVRPLAERDNVMAAAATSQGQRSSNTSQENDT
jgi:phenylacetate-CoA ligase